MTEDEQQQACGSAIAAFTLAQMTFAHLVTIGSLSKEQAAEMLNQAIAANSRGGLANNYAAQRLEMFRDGMKLGRPKAN
jgi:hypothetical protein